jgi:LmbE family N-acetylglucosaminyl deacetylase
MNLSQPNAELYVPDNTEETSALARTTHLAIGAHQDDLEIMAFDGILACFQQPDQWFIGVVVTNGAGSARTGVYANYTDDEMVEVRNKEQRKAAVIGEFSAQFLLDHPSSHVKSAEDHGVVSDYVTILEATQPKIVYAHNLADKHDTHIGVTLRLIEAIRSLPAEKRPEKMYGCEVWRDLDWLVDDDKVAFDVSPHENLQTALVGVFDSQIAGGKRYDLATMGRRRAHATYHESHGVDETTGTIFAMDLTPLVTDASIDPLEYTQSFVSRLNQDIADRFSRVTS